MRRKFGRVLAGLALALSTAACGLLAGERPALGIENGTTLVVTLFVNDVLVVTDPPGGPAPEINRALLPPLPWLVEARSTTGRLLTSMRVEPGQVWSTARANGGSESQGTLGRVDLSCGRLTIWAGDTVPSGPAPPPNPGQPGDCLP